MKRLTLVCILMSGCAVTTPYQKGSIAISADAAGMRAFSDTLNALVTNGKQSADTTSAAWVTRQRENELLSGILDGGTVK